MTMNLEETIAELRLATAVRHHRDHLAVILGQLIDQVAILDNEIRATLGRIEEERPGDNYAWMVTQEAYVLIPEDSDQELI